MDLSNFIDDVQREKVIKNRKVPSEAPIREEIFNKVGGIQGMGIVWRRRGNETREGRDPRVMPNEDLELEQMV